MTVLVLVAFPDPHSELHEPHELHEDTWQSITGEKRLLNSVFASTNMCDVFMGPYMYEVL